jgi:hypothetical protein
LLKCTSHSDNTTIKSPKGGIVNVALADPSSFSVHAGSGQLWSEKHRSWVLSSLVGQTTYFSPSDIRQICVTPFSHGWYRFVAVLATVYGQRSLYFPSFKGGITLGTNRYDSNGFGTTARQGKAHVAPIIGSVLKQGEKSRCMATNRIIVLTIFSPHF